MLIARIIQAEFLALVFGLPESCLWVLTSQILGLPSASPCSRVAQPVHSEH